MIDYRAAGYWAGETFAGFLARVTTEFADRTALVDDGQRLTYGELADRTSRVAVGMRELGVRRGDRVLVQLPNRTEFVVVWFALQRLGAVPVHAQPAHRQAELIGLARLSGAVAHVVPDVHARLDYRALADTVCAAVPSLCHVIVVGDPGRHIAFADLLSAAPAPMADPARSDDLALLLLSGGTTGTPKLIPRTHDDYLYNGRAAAGICRLHTGSVYLATLPVAFNFTMNCPGVLGTLGAGGTVVLTGSQDPSHCFALIERERVTITSITPPLAPLWLDEVSGADLSSLAVMQIGGSRLADELAARMIARFGGAVQQVFGMAEGLVCMTRLDDPPGIVATTQGRPVSPGDEIRVVDERGADLPDGHTGELLTRGPYTLRGYYRADAHNARAFADGYYRTGDLVRRLPSGHLVVAGRVKDQIQRGGEKIAAAEIEDHLRCHPAIRSVAVVAGPDDILGERIVAFVVPTGELPARRELAAFLTGRGLAAYKTVDEVRAIDDLPRTPVGKIDKRRLPGVNGGPMPESADQPYAVSASVITRLTECVMARTGESTPDAIADFFEKTWAVAPRPVREVLEICCGNGRILRALADRGFAVSGLDASAAMLGHARHTLGPDVELVHAELPDVPIDRRFDAVVSVAAGLNYLTGEPDLERTFGQVARLLPSGATFVFDLLSRHLLKEVHDTKGWSVDLGDLAAMARFDSDPSTDHCDYHYTQFTRTPGGAYAAHRETHRLHAFAPEVVRCLALRSGFRSADVVDNYTARPASTTTEYETWVLVRD